MRQTILEQTRLVTGEQVQIEVAFVDEIAPTPAGKLPQVVRLYEPAVE